MDGIKLTGSYTVATAQAAKAASRLAGTAGIHSSTSAQATILCNFRTQATRSVTTYHGHHRFTVGNGHTQQVGYLAHHFLSAHGTHQPVDAAGIGTLDQGVGQTSTSGKSATAAVSTWQLFCHLSYAGVFIDREFLGADIQHQGCYQTDSAQDQYCNQNEIHNSLKYLF